MVAAVSLRSRRPRNPIILISVTRWLAVWRFSPSMRKRSRAASFVQPTRPWRLARRPARPASKLAAAGVRRRRLRRGQAAPCACGQRRPGGGDRQARGPGRGVRGDPAALCGGACTRLPGRCRRLVQTCEVGIDGVAWVRLSRIRQLARRLARARPGAEFESDPE